MSRLTNAVYHQLARRGFVVRRHPAVRRQRQFEATGIDVALDVGAARGHWGRELRDFGFTGRIVSFEPIAAPYADLVAASAGDPTWDTRNAALGDVAGQQQINVASNSDSSSLLPMAEQHREAAPDIAYVGAETITVERLDDIADEYLAADARAFLKVDTQGFERAVLTGAEATLPRIRGLQLEVSFVTLYEGGMLADEAISWAYDHGFVLTGIDQGFADPGGAILQADAIFFRP